MESVSAGGGSSGGLLLVAANFFRSGRGVLRDAFAGNGDQAEAVTFQGIVPADAAAFWVQAENFTSRGGEQVVAVENDVDEFGSFERRGPKRLAGCGIDGYHRAFDAEVDDF